MSTVRELHDEAMRLAQLAQVARHDGDEQRAQQLAHQAYQYEAQAAELVPNAESSQPTHAILHRSAASLAFQGKAFEEALNLIDEGLAANPPQPIQQELTSLRGQVQLELTHHKQAHGARASSRR